VSRSLYRQANLEGYMPSYEHRWIGSARRDPARIQLRVPNGRYDSLYLIAAADEEPDRVPLVCAMFFRPGAGFAETFEAKVPRATATSTEAHRLPVTLANGKAVGLWLVKVPLDPGRLSAFSDLDIVEVELTKKVHQFRSYPDPFIYGWHQGGPASAVHVYAATLGEARATLDVTPDVFGHVWTAPPVPGYTVRITSPGGAEQKGRLTVQTRSHDGTETTRQERPVHLLKGGTQTVKLSVPVKRNGYHELTATLELVGKQPLTWTEKRSLSNRTSSPLATDRFLRTTTMR
jgi:hypothetical protein